MKLRVVERSGRSLKGILQKSDPFKSKTCSDIDRCMVCSTGGKGRCRVSSVTYKIECNECSDVYIGETARNAYTRGREHMDDYIKKQECSILLRHATKAHSNNAGERPDYKMSVVGVHSDALTRQITEAVMIRAVPDDRLINNKTEWAAPFLPRIQLSASNN